jgi:hypothetical protein
MKAFQILVAIGGILLFVGIGLVIYAVSPGSISETATIPSGSDWYVFYEFNLLAGGRIQATITERAGGVVDVYVYTRSQYASYQTGSYPANLFQTSGTTSSVDVTLPETGTYFLVVEHGTGYEGASQEVQVTATINGVDPGFLVGGIVVVALGAILTAVGVAKRRKAMGAAPPMAPPPSDVVMYEQPKPPGP